MIKLNNNQIVQLYMTTGGVPYYLDQAQSNLSATQLIERLAFRKDSLLFKEFDNLFSSLFDDAESYTDLIRIIANKKHGIGQEEIIKKSDQRSRGGRIVKKLNDLARSCPLFLRHTPI